MLPEHPIVISPTLAATIGLEEAVLLQVLLEVVKHRGLRRSGSSTSRWVRLQEEELLDSLPFWSAEAIRRILDSLRTLGMVSLKREPTGNSWLIALEMDGHDSVAPPVRNRRMVVPPVGVSEVPGPRGTGHPIDPGWQPNDTWIKLCKQHSIPEEFIRSLIPGFVVYWRERGQARFSWGNAFYKHVLRQWRQEETRRGAHELASTMSPEWRPSQEAVAILEKAEVNTQFIKDAVPEFVLYWREKGDSHGAWNTRFIQHIRRQWAKFVGSFGVDSTPRPITADWQPSSEFYEVLQLAEIDEDYARRQIPEFVMHWKDRQEARASWNTVFLGWIKMNWARRLKDLQARGGTDAEDQILAGSTEEKVRARLEQLADRSWAD